MQEFSTILLILMCNVFNAFSNHESGAKQDFYIGAVVEYAPIGTPWDSTPEELLEKNTAKYTEIISQAAQQNADIVVFPEYGLTTIGMPRDRLSARPYLQVVPEVGNNPCLSKKVDSQVIRNLSCAARTHGIYTVVNLGEILLCSLENVKCPKSSSNECPPDEAFHYNTNVVFDRQGSIIAKYHKYQLYFEDQFDAPSTPELVTFHTDFGVTFGIFTCFDIIFRDPAVEHVASGIRNFIFPSAWVDELPFLMAPQSHSIWAMGANATVLASGYHQPLGGQLGSGIYSGHSGPLNYTFNPESGTTLVLAEIPLIPKLPDKLTKSISVAQENYPDYHQYHSFLHENLSKYSTTILDLSRENELTICTENKFCCTLKYSPNIPNDIQQESETRNYRLIAFNGIRPVAQETSEFAWQVCGVIRCLNESLTSCTQRETDLESELINFELFHLSSSSFSLDGVMKPSLNTLDTSFSVIPFSYFSFTSGADSEGGQANITHASSGSLANIALQTVAIINRIYFNKK